MVSCISIMFSTKNYLTNFNRYYTLCQCKFLLIVNHLKAALSATPHPNTLNSTFTDVFYVRDSCTGDFLWVDGVGGTLYSANFCLCSLIEQQSDQHAFQTLPLVNITALWPGLYGIYPSPSKYLRKTLTQR